jgi:prepilin-type N-terminal cleavage/methylation domain-containing protein
MNRPTGQVPGKRVSIGLKRRGIAGFTLIELVIVIAVIGIMLAVAVPAIMAVTNRAGAQYAADELYSVLMVAKMRAVRNNTTCTVTINLDPANSYNMTKYRGNVILTNSPNAADPVPAAAITFTRQGFSLPPWTGDVYLQETNNNVFWRVRTTVGGTSTVDRYSTATGLWR